jgi:hypothetical protein
MRLFKLTALALLLATPLAAMAQTSPAKMQLAQKMYDINETGSVFQSLEYSVVSNIMGNIGQGLGDKASCPALQPEAQTFKVKMDTLFNGMNDASFHQQALQVYADTFSEDEMRQIIAFMQSPAGIKMKRVMPEMSKRVGGIAEARMKAHEQEIRTAAGGFATNIQKIAATCPSTPAAAPQPPKK